MRAGICPSFKSASLFALCDVSVVPSVLGFDKVPWWGTLLISLGFSLLTAVVVWFIVCPRLKKKIERKLQPFHFTRLFFKRVFKFLLAAKMVVSLSDFAFTQSVFTVIKGGLEILFITESVIKMIKRCHQIDFHHHRLR